MPKILAWKNLPEFRSDMAGKPIVREVAGP
jgi:hypothetical protein